MGETHIGDLDIGDESDPDWTEALTIASSLLAARIGSGEAIVAGYQDLRTWAIEEKPVDIAIKRLLSVIEALVRYGECGLGVTAAGLDNPTAFEDAPLGPGTTAADVLNYFTGVIETVKGDDFTIT